MTSSADPPGAPARALLAAGTAAYDCHDFAALDKVPGSLKAIAATLTALGYTTVASAPGYSINPGLDDLRAAVRRAGRAAPLVVFYYTGHGIHPDLDTYYLVTQESAPGNLIESALPATDLPKLLTRRDDKGEVMPDQPTVLVILDCCFAGSGGMEMLGNTLRGIGNPNTWVIASAGDLQYAQQGQFATAFANALRRPTTGSSQRACCFRWHASPASRSSSAPAVTCFTGSASRNSQSTSTPGTIGIRKP